MEKILNASLSSLCMHPSFLVINQTTIATGTQKKERSVLEPVLFSSIHEPEEESYMCMQRLTQSLPPWNSNSNLVFNCQDRLETITKNYQGSRGITP